MRLLLQSCASTHTPFSPNALAVQFGFFSILVMQGVVFFARQGHGLNDSRLFKLYIGLVLLFTTQVLTSRSHHPPLQDA